MFRARMFALALIALLVSAWSTAEAGGWSVRVGIGVPLFVGPCYGCYRPYYYYPPYPAVIVNPAPVVVQPVPVVQAAPPVQPSYQSSSPPQDSAPEEMPAPKRVVPLPAAPQAVAPVGAETRPAPLNQRQLDIENNLRLLADRNERVREEAVLALGRARAVRAVDPLAATLAGDASPSVREVAARSLGLIGSPKALPALRRAAQVDSDKDVRRSAQFAIDVVQVTGSRQ